MAEQADKDQKNHAPTAQKLAKSVEEGDVLISRELASALAILVAALWLFVAGSSFVTATAAVLAKGLQFSSADLIDFAPGESIGREAAGTLIPLGWLFAGTIVAAVISVAALGSLGWRNKSLAAKGSRINPFAGLKRIFGTHGLAEMLKAMAKTILLGGIGYQFFMVEMPTILALSGADVVSAATAIGQEVQYLVLFLALGLVLIALIDVPVQWFQRNKRLMMSFDEVKRETKENDGSPEVKGQQRARQREILSGSARKAVAEASVVLTNPTHFSVALRYRPGIDHAPVVVARGRGETALAIRSLARGADVPILEYPQLTRALYYSVRSGRVIPEDLFMAVAVILAFVFRLNGAAAGSTNQPNVDVPAAFRFDAEGRPSSGAP